MVHSRQLVLEFPSTNDLLAELSPVLRAHIAAVDPTHGCWLGQPTDKDGYGKVGKDMLHRLVWHEIVGPIPPGLVLDHYRLDQGLPCSRSCCLPDHLQPVTRLWNLNKSPRANMSKVRCDHGHPFSSDNTYIRPNGHRDCRACVRRRVREYRGRLQVRRWGSFREAA